MSELQKDIADLNINDNDDMVIDDLQIGNVNLNDNSNNNNNDGNESDIKI
jgi:hypothetical protein